MKIKNLSVLLVLIASPLVLLASSSTDSKIEDAAKSSYNFRTVLDNNVKVKAKDGIVTLTGTVQDNGDRDLAADTVENLPGVLGVENQIKVEPTYAEHSDAWMAVKIRSRLLVKGNVSATSTKVAVNDGNVTLTGTADNMAQKELTEAYAKDIDGVKMVTNDIVVQDKYADMDANRNRDGKMDRTRDNKMDNSRDRTAGEVIDDASITSQVKYALLSHKSTSALKTKVTTTNGVVRVTGDANSDAEKSLVTKLASDVRGAKSVTNDMTVKS